MPLLRSRSLWKIALLVSVGLTRTQVSRAEWAIFPEQVPLARLVANTETYIKTHPDEAQGYYLLGRLHSLAFATERKMVTVVRERRFRRMEEPKPLVPFRFPPWDTILVARESAVRNGRKENTPSLPAEAKQHLRESVQNYRRATQLAPQEALYFLGLGWMLEQGSVFSEELEGPGEASKQKLTPAERAALVTLTAKLNSPSAQAQEQAERTLLAQFERALPVLLELRAQQGSHFPRLRARINRLLTTAWQDRALGAYRHAYDLCLASDLKNPDTGPAADTRISQEAGEGILRIYASRALTPLETADAQKIHQALKPLQNVGIAVTPILFPLRGNLPLSALLAPGKTVTFDLAGDGVPRRWPWVTPETGILVWDPKGAGKIKSGQQLFGSATWWMFWKNGYQPLAALDDNHDGWLSGSELEGIAVWRDKNGNGVADPGEVVPLRAFGIIRLAVRPAGTHQGTLYNPHGLQRHDGTFLPTYDWTPTSLPTAEVKTAIRK